MGRAAGALNRDHAETRAELARRLAQHLLANGASLPSLRTLAEGAGVDPGTIRHYFGDRRGAVGAALETLIPYASEQRTHALALAHLPVEEALSTFLSRIAKAWPGLGGSMHATGLVEGLVDGTQGSNYLRCVLEPLLATAEELLTSFGTRNVIGVSDVRLSALALVSPVLLACLHQVQLQGGSVRPLDLDGFIGSHVQLFLRSHGTPAARSQAS